MPLLLGAVVVLLFALVLVRGPAPAGGLNRSVFELQEIPKASTHNHASYEVVICGEKKPALGATMEAALHTHGDATLHIEIPPNGDGRRATVQNFIALAGGVLTEDSFRYPGEGKTWKNGDLCPDGNPGRVKILQGGKESPFGPGTIPRGTPQAEEKNHVRIEFG